MHQENQLLVIFYQKTEVRFLVRINLLKNFYSTNLFKKKISKKLNIKNFKDVKKTILREKILENEGNIKKLEKVIHPIVRKEMFKFMKKHKKKNFIFFEIPLLIENKLEKNFDVIFFIKAKKT